MRKSAPKAGTSKFISHIAIRGIGPGAGIMLEAREFVDKKKTPDFVRGMLRKQQRSGLRFDTVLADREFNNTACMRAIDDLGLKFVMPAKKSPPITRLVEEYVMKKSGPIRRYTIRGSDGDEFTHYVVIVEREPADDPDNESMEDAVKRHAVFATNRRYRSVREMVESIPEEYRARWDIETGFRTIKSVMGKTTSNSSAIRILLFYLPVIVSNLWEISKFYDDEYEWGGYAGGARFTIAIFVNCLVITGSFVNDRGK